jgi:TolA-binding protein
MTDPVHHLLDRYTAVLGDSERDGSGVGRLEQRVRGTLRQRAQQRAVSLRRLQIGAAALLVAGLFGAGAAYQLGQSRGQALASRPMPAGEWLTSRAGVPTETKFSDGSSLALQGESRARVQFEEKTGGLVHLDSGLVRLKVKHRDGSTWRVAAGPYEVEAIGTEFVVDWSSTRTQPLRVSVSEGTVAVRGVGIQGTRFVSAQQSFEVSSEPAVPTVPLEELELLPIPSASAAAAPSAMGAAAEPWRSLEAAGKYDEAVRAAERRGLPALYRSATADELLGLARAGRFSGRTDVASDALMACRQRFPGSKQAAMAAFLLGRASSGRTAAQWFSTYLAEAPGGALGREALGRLLEAQLEGGDQAAVKASATRYLKSYPDGPHVALAREVLGR